MVAEEIAAAEEVLVVAVFALVHAEAGGVVADRFEAGQAGAAAMVSDHFAGITRDATGRLADAVDAMGAFAAVGIGFAGVADDPAWNRANPTSANEIVAAAGGVFAAEALVLTGAIRADSAQAE